MRPSSGLLATELFNIRSELLDLSSRVDISYERAKAIGAAYNLSSKDVLELSPKFWAMHTDPITCLDGAATTILTIQYNLVVGTIAKFATKRKDLAELVEDLLAFKILGQFCLTEINHGLDAFNLETTATLLPSGEYELHTPSPFCAKYMPPTVPVKGLPCIGIVFAQLIVNSESRGTRPFLVKLNDGFHMEKGISARLLPPRGGSKPVNHSLTIFDRCLLPPTALLGTLAEPQSAHKEFLASIWRVAVGTLALASIAIPALEITSFVGARYSIRRHVSGPNGKRVPIISFRTQQIPLFAAIAQASVMRVFHDKAVKIFLDPRLDIRVRQSVAACAKAVLIQHSQSAHLAISERCGAQGLFECNQISSLYHEIRGISIAEGDILGLSIRTVADILAERYQLPPPTDPTSLLARHENALIQECISDLKRAPNPMENFNKFVLPRCQRIVEAIGHRMAYDAAVEKCIRPCLVDLYVCNAIKADPSWYVENGQSRREISEMEDKALDEVLPLLQELLDATQVESYVTAPIVADETWEAFIGSLGEFSSLKFA